MSNGDQSQTLKKPAPRKTKHVEVQ